MSDGLFPFESDSRKSLASKRFDDLGEVSYLADLKHASESLVDLFSRWAYAEVHDKLGQAMSLKVALRAQAKANFRFVMLQTDNGPEFQKYFHDMLAVRKITLRHSRVRQSNDNAHVERFNRTLQDELTTGYPLRRNVTQERLNEYLDYYNNDRRRMGIAMRRPAELTVTMMQRS